MPSLKGLRGRLKALWKPISDADTAFSLADRVLGVVVGSTLSGVIGGMIGWLLINPYAGLVVGLLVWILIASGLLVKISNDTKQNWVAVSQTENPPSRIPSPQELSPEMVTQSELRDLSFHIADLVREGNSIRNRTFERCTMHGPAMVAIFNSVLPGQTYIGRPDELLWETDMHPKAKIGVILIENCVLRDCTFVGIGVAGTSVEIQAMRQNSR